MSESHPREEFEVSTESRKGDFVPGGDPVSRKELWAYYLYWNGDSGVGPFGYSLILFQRLATLAGYDPVRGPGSSCVDAEASGNCVLPWLNGTKNVTSIVLISNGLSFMFAALIFVTLGPAADYGDLGRWLLLFFTIVCWITQFGFLGATTPDQWRLAMGLSMLSFISCATTYVFLAAAAMKLASNTPEAIESRRRYGANEIRKEAYEKTKSLEKNRISNISWVHNYVGYMFTLCLALSILVPLQNNSKAGNYTIALVNGYWILSSSWWFIFLKPRPGPPLPKGKHYLTLGWMRMWEAVQHYRRLPYTFIYLFGYFLLADALNTTMQLVFLCQNEFYAFSLLQQSYLGLAQSSTSIISITVFWYVQKYWRVDAKKMFIVACIATVLLPLWGMIGIWTKRFGLRNGWEFWAFNVFSGLQAPYYSFSQSIMSELCPPGFEYMFFGLYGLSNRASSIIGPVVIQSIIDNAHGNNWMGFSFTFALATVATLVIWFGVDMEKGRKHAEAFASNGPSSQFADPRTQKELE